MPVEELRQEDYAFQANLYASQNPVRRWLHNARRAWVMQMLEDVTPPQPSFLEVGIGCGIFTKSMAARGRVTALDINPHFVEAANRIPGVEARVADILHERPPPIHDVAVCSEVIEHVPDSLTALRNIHAALKPQGVLILTTPNSYSTMELFARLLAYKPVVKLAQVLYGEAVADLGHINRLTHRRVRQQIAQAGFTVVAQADVGLYLPVLAEFGGAPGLRISRWLERRCARSGALSNLLWTQCWLLRKSADAAGNV